MNFLEKIRSLSQLKRKLILWSLMVLFAAGLIFWFVDSARNRIGNFNGQKFENQLNFPDVSQDLNKVNQLISTSTKKILPGSGKNSTPAAPAD